jgi:hypothetical protein
LPAVIDFDSRRAHRSAASTAATPATGRWPSAPEPLLPDLSHPSRGARQKGPGARRVLSDTNSQTSETSPVPASTRCTRAAKIPWGTATRCDPRPDRSGRGAVLWKRTPTVAVSCASRRVCGAMGNGHRGERPAPVRQHGFLHDELGGGGRCEKLLSRTDSSGCGRARRRSLGTSRRQSRSDRRCRGHPDVLSCRSGPTRAGPRHARSAPPALSSGRPCC